MNKNRKTKPYLVEPETVMAAYQILIINCRNRHYSCQGCPLHITDPEPYPSGIPRYTCAAFPSGNIPPASWPELDPNNMDGGQVVELDIGIGQKKLESIKASIEAVFEETGKKEG